MSGSIDPPKSSDAPGVPRVLLVHPNSSRAQALRCRLAADVSVTPKVEEAVRLLGLRSTDLLLSDARWARRLLKEADRVNHRGERVFLYSMRDSETVRALAEIASEGHVFSTIDEDAPVGDVARRVQQILFARTSERTAPGEILQAVFDLAGSERRFEVVDVGNRGLGLRLEGIEPLEQLQPGTSLLHLRLEKGSDVVLRAERAVVRQVRFQERANPPYFQLGVEFPQQRELFRGQSTNDPVRVLGLIRRALAREGSRFSVKSIENANEVFELSSVAFETLANRNVICGEAPEGSNLAVGDIVELAFDVSGLSHSGLTAVLFKASGERCIFSVPKSLSTRHRRTHGRFKVTEAHPFAVTFRSPITGERFVRPVVDLQTIGLAFPVNPSREIFPPGLVLNEISLALPDGQSVMCKGIVKAIGPLPRVQSGSVATHKCGVSLTHVPPVARKAILEAFIAERSPAIVPATPDDFPDIWKTVREARGHYPDYPLEAGPHLNTLEAAHRALVGQEDALGRTLLYTDEGVPIGHINGLRFYSKTWVLQHLAVPPGFSRDKHVARDLVALSAEFAETLDDVEFVRQIWNVANRWPNRLGTWIARAIMRISPGLGYLRHFNYLYRTLDSCPEAERTVVREGVAADARWLERHLTRKGQGLRVRADDLGQADWDLHGLKARFEKAGLHRSRRLFAVGEVGHPRAIALSDEATDGLHWGELVNGFSLIIAEPEGPEADALRRDLAWRCMQHSAERGRRSVAAMVEDADVATLKTLGFTSQARFAEFTFHRSTVQLWCQQSSALYERLSWAIAKAAEEKSPQVAFDLPSMG